jgi:AraC-like DNA-binding protein
MRSAKADDSRDDLQRFADGMQRGAAIIERLSAAEQRVRWRTQDRAGHTQVAALRSGMSLMTARVRWERPWSMAVAQPPSRLKLMLLRGAGPRLSVEGETRALSAATFHVSQIKRPVALAFDFDAAAGASEHEELALEIDRARLCELLGTAQLPAAVQRVLDAGGAYPSVELAMSASLSRVFDDIASCDARRSSRQLFLEAKGLELLAACADVLDEDTRAPRLSQHDIDCLERARRVLVSQLAQAPSLPVLARAAGLSETKLKAGFRALFGDSVHAYLRARRMEEAERHLRERRYGVTEVALRVGYANPSKFAAAFRRHFGVPPGRR